MKPVGSKSVDGASVKGITLHLTKEKATCLYDFLCVSLGELELNEHLDKNGAYNAYINLVKLRCEINFKLKELEGGVK
jgi:hypothetical protein